MAREIHEREDLLRDAKAFQPRIQLRLTWDDNVHEVFAGFRTANAVSLYFDTEPVYHFNSAGELRRAFVRGRLIKAERGKLAAWQPQRSQQITEMLRHDFSQSEERQFCQSLQEHVGKLREALRSEKFEIVGQEPADEDALPRLIEWLEEFREVRIATSPRVS